MRSIDFLISVWGSRDPLATQLLSLGLLFQNNLFSGKLLPQGAGFPHSRPSNRRFRPYLLGDAAFRAETFLVNNFPGHPSGTNSKRAFNINHCRMRRCIENSFGHLKGAFRVLCKPCTQDPVFLSKVVRVCCALHNLRKLDDDPSYSTFTPDERAAQIPQADDNPYHGPRLH